MALSANLIAAISDKQHRPVLKVEIDWDGPNCTRKVTSAGELTCTYPRAGTYTIFVGRGSTDGPWLTAFGCDSLDCFD